MKPYFIHLLLEPYMGVGICIRSIYHKPLVYNGHKGDVFLSYIVFSVFQTH